MTDGAKTIHWVGNVIDIALHRTDSSDTITGNSVANFLESFDSTGGDIISSRDGDDIIENGDETGADSLSGEGDNDEIRSLGDDTNDDDVIDTSGGNDNGNGRGGDDTTNMQDEFGGDVVDCGPGTDTVESDASDLINPNCEN